MKDGLWRLMLPALAVVSACTQSPWTAQPHVVASSPREAGRYIVMIGGCNDCHTPCWEDSAGKMATSEWLTGNPVGVPRPLGHDLPSQPAPVRPTNL
jgi:hypothetical protein